MRNKCEVCNCECDMTELVLQDGDEQEMCPDCAEEAENNYYSKN